jgi:outer membrane receptor protein involved in Fe transport
MKLSLLALSLGLALATSAAHAATAIASPLPAPASGDEPQQTGTRNKQPVAVKELGAVSVSAALDRARNSLSPDTGSSQYVIDEKAIAQLPLGASTPLNQVLLQAPGVVQSNAGNIYVRGDHANLQYRVNGITIPESISGFGQTLDARIIQRVSLLDGALPAEYGLRTAAIVDITTKTGHDLGNGGSVGIAGGQFGTLNPNASIWGNKDRWSYFVTANYLENDVGIENPTPSRNAIHDRTNQVKGFGTLSYLINDDTRLSLLFGATNNRFQIPNNPGQEPQFGYLDTVNFDSSRLNERQQEKTRFGVLSLQGKLGDTHYQVAAGQRYTSLNFTPDVAGDLIFNGVAAGVGRTNRASTLQADFSTPLGDRHTLRYGVYSSFERALSRNDALVFPADAAGNQTSTTPLSIDDGSRILARTYSAYLQDEWSIGDKWTVNYGARADKYEAFGKESQLSPRLGVIYQATQNTTVHAGYSRYFTPPATEQISASNIAKFQGTTNQVDNLGNNTPLSERTSYYDLGISQNVTPALTLGLDAYYRKVKRIQDEGQFGAALVYSSFNYNDGRIHGVEFTANYDSGPISAYFNLTQGSAKGRKVITSQYNFAPADLAYIADHYIHLDHDQKRESSGGITYAIDDVTRVGANYLYGSGLRKDGLVPNGAHVPSYFELNLNISHDFNFASTGKVHTQLAVLNALDRSYQIRDGSGIGVGAPQFGRRRGVYLSVQKDF